MVNPLMGTLELHSSGPLCNNTAIGRLAVGGWAVTLVQPGIGSSRTVLELEDSSRTQSRGLGLGL